MAWWLPAIAILTGVLSLYSTIDSYNARNKTIDYTRQSNAEVERFWNDYYNNTGYRPLYPYRNGAVVNEGYIDALYAANWQSASAMTGGVFNTSQNAAKMYSQRRNRYGY